MPQMQFNRGFSGCDDKMAILRHQTVPRRLDEDDKIEELDEINWGDLVYVDHNGTDAKVDLRQLRELVSPEQEQADWLEEDAEQYSYIKNKPVIGETFAEEDFTVGNGVGAILVGDQITKGTPWADVIKLMLMSTTSNYFTIYWDVVDTDPRLANASRFHNSKKVTMLELLNNGFEWPGRYTIHNGWHVLAFKSSVELNVDTMIQEGHIVDQTEGLVSHTHGGYKYFYLKNRTSGKFGCSYTFTLAPKESAGGIYFGTLSHRPLEVLDTQVMRGYKHMLRTDLVKDGFECTINCEADSEGAAPYACIAVSGALHADCESVTNIDSDITYDVDTSEGLVSSERFGDWTFYYFEQPMIGEFKLRFNFKWGA